MKVEVKNDWLERCSQATQKEKKRSIVDYEIERVIRIL